MALNIKVQKAPTQKAKPNPDALGFGRFFTDHMFLMDYTKGKGWHDPRIVPYGPISLDPAAVVFHYSQEIFEGMKAYKGTNGDIRLFRPDKNMERMNISADRICMPALNIDDALQAIKELVTLEQDWIPTREGTSLYIRPFMIATEAFLGVHPAKNYLFVIILSPVGAYYPEGVAPVKIYIETKYVRAVKGGTGFTKTGGNYAASIKSQMEAQTKGFTQVLWLDGVHRKYIEEVGTMNVFFKINGEIITPALEGSILGGVTRSSCIELLKKWGYKVNEREISIDELVAAHAAGKLEEAFGTGTAAVISPIGEIVWEDRVLRINDFEIGPVSQKLYDSITAIQSGKAEDPFGWVVIV